MEVSLARRHCFLSAEPRLAELLIDCEEDRTVRAVLVGMLWNSG
jgi:hypothetical protein